MTEEGDKQMEGISELLRCYICMERLSNATICPHCSKLGCFACIKRWVTDNRSNCPHCRNALTLRDLIKIPLFDDLGQVLDNLHAVKKEVAISSSSEQEKCAVHREKMSVYCESCKVCICHECALWSQEHKGHDFKPLDQIYKDHVEILQVELCKLKERLKIILGQVQLVERKIESVKANKSKVKRELTHTVEKMFHHLDETAKGKVVTLNEFRRHLSSQALEITKELHDIEKTITGGNITSLISNSGELKTEVSTVINRLLTSTQKMESLPTIANFVNEVVPEYDSAVFKITSFRQLQRRGEEVYSNPMVVQGLTWRLKVYPNGHKEEVGNYLAVFVELAEGYSAVSSYQYRIEMLYACSNKFPHRNHTREYASEFADGESWGYRKYYELSRLLEDGFIKDDTLILKFSIRPPTFHQKYQDQTHYLEKIVKERDALKQQLESSKEQITSLKTEYKAKLAEQRQAATSRTAPSQPDSQPHQPLPLPSSSSQSSHSRRSHQHSHSAPHGHPRRERNARLKPENFISHQPIHSPTHSPMHHHASPKQSAHYNMVPHTEGRLISTGEAYHSHTHLYPARRRSNEDPPDAWKHVQEQRRKSADLTDQNLRLARTQHTNERKQERSLSQYVPSSSHSGSKGKGKEKPKFLESSSSEDLEAADYSQQWDEGVVNPTDITITLQDEEGERIKSNTSSSSTLIDSGSPPRELKCPPPAQQHQQLKKYQDLSQEPFGEEEMLLSDAGPTPIPLSNLPPYEHSSYFGEYQEHYTAPPPPPQSNTLSKHEMTYLSQPTYPSPPKSRHGKSLTDLTSSSNISLSSSQQFLSMSTIDMQNLHDMHRYSDSPRTQISDARRGGHDSRYRGSRGAQLPRMSSDSHLNKSYTPGLQKSVIYALSEVKEEVEQRKHHNRGGSTHHPRFVTQQQVKSSSPHTKPAQRSPRKGQLQQSHLQATKLKEDKVVKETSRKKPQGGQKTAQDAATKSRGSETEKKKSPTLSATEKKRVEVVKESSPETPARHLGSKMKSSSTSSGSLNNLSQIL